MVYYISRIENEEIFLNPLNNLEIYNKRVDMTELISLSKNNVILGLNRLTGSIQTLSPDKALTIYNAKRKLTDCNPIIRIGTEYVLQAKFEFSEIADRHYCMRIKAEIEDNVESTLTTIEILWHTWTIQLAEFIGTLIREKGIVDVPKYMLQGITIDIIYDLPTVTYYKGMGIGGVIPAPVTINSIKFTDRFNPVRAKEFSGMFSILRKEDTIGLIFPDILDLSKYEMNEVEVMKSTFKCYNGKIRYPVINSKLKNIINCFTGITFTQEGMAECIDKVLTHIDTQAVVKSIGDITMTLPFYKCDMSDVSDELKTRIWSIFGSRWY